jgi:hypothetical protein
MIDVPDWMKDPERVKQVQREYALQTHPEQINTFENICVLIKEIRRCWTDEDYRKAQQHLGKHIERVDAAVGKANIARSRAETQLRRFYQKNIPQKLQK